MPKIQKHAINSLTMLSLGLAIGWGGTSLWQARQFDQKQRQTENHVRFIFGQLYSQIDMLTYLESGNINQTLLSAGIIPTNMIILEDKEHKTGKLVTLFGGHASFHKFDNYVRLTMEAVPSQVCRNFADMLGREIVGTSIGLEASPGLPQLFIPRGDQTSPDAISRDEHIEKAQSTAKEACGTDSWRTVSLYLD